MPLDVRWAHSLWSSTCFCVLCGGPNKPSLVQAFRIASFGPIEASSTLPVPRPYCCSCPRVVKAASLHRSMYVPCNFASPQDIWKKTTQNLYFFLCLFPWLPPADGTTQQLLALPGRRRAAEGLTLNPCLRLPPSLLAFTYWIRINWNFHKGWYKSLSQVSRCRLTRVELC